MGTQDGMVPLVLKSWMAPFLVLPFLVLGFDQILDQLEKGPDNADHVREGTPAAFPEVARKIREQFSDGVESIRDLFEERGGREWWQTNGVEFYHAVFDLTAGSRSLKVFNKYWLDREKGGLPLCLKNPT